MYLIFRLLPTDPDLTLTYSEGEERRLREAVAAAPGVLKVDDIMRHPRGGYLVSMDQKGPAQEIADQLRAAGWMTVM